MGMRYLIVVSEGCGPVRVWGVVTGAEIKRRESSGEKETS
jgi:hypothetical protein